MKETVSMIKNLSNANGAPGFEDEVIKEIRNYSNGDLDFKSDAMKNLYITGKKSNSRSEMTIMLDAHSDEVAFMVQNIRKNGLIKLIPLGGWVAHHVSSQKMRILNNKGNYVKGVVSSKSTHFLSAEELHKGPDPDDICVDVGACSREEVLNSFSVEVGAPVIPDVEFEFFEEKGLMMGKAFDNRLGCACVVEVLKRIETETLPYNLIGAIAGQEEVGTRGARVTARKVNPQIAIVFEGTPADDSFRDREEAQSILRSGPQIRLLDKSMVSNPELASLAKRIAIQMDIPVQFAVRKGGGTNAGAIHLSNGSVPTLVLGIPVRYVHSHHGIATIEDFENCVNLAVGILNHLKHEGLNFGD